MKLALSEQINQDKTLLIIAFNKHQLAKMNKLSGVEIDADYKDWDFVNKSQFLTQYEKSFILIDFINKPFSEKLYVKHLQKSLTLIKQLHITDVQLMIDSTIDSNNLLFQIALTCNKFDYKFDKYKQKKEDTDELNFTIVKEKVNDQDYLALEEALAIVDGIKVTKDLTNEPANIIYPETLAAFVQELGKSNGFDVQIFGKKDIEDFGMHAFLSVAQGALHEPKLIVMKYMGNPDQPKNILGLVGKGLTYDSGGYSLKTTAGMFTMKADMAGSASVIGAMTAIAKMKLKKNVVGVVAACENLISEKAYKPGDVIKSMAGKTIEIGNTDAEGRLTLIDAVYYAVKKENAIKVVDVATLTGAVVVGLGTVRSGVVSNDDDFYKLLEDASENSGELFWRLPHDDDYEELLKSEIADTNNIGGRPAGTITAALFIRKFVPNSTSWLHLDIAGTAYSVASSPKGATGVPVATLYFLAKLNK